MGKESIAIIDFGSQYTQLIARRVREARVYCEIFPHDAPKAVMDAFHPQGFILSGGPASVYGDGAPKLPPYVLESRLPVLGLCYGMQLQAQALGGRVAHAEKGEYGPMELSILLPKSPLFAELPSTQTVWMSHGDRVEALPPGFVALATTANSPLAAMVDKQERIYGLQFHPEVIHTHYGKEIIRNFLYRVCGCQGTWTPASFIEETVANVRSQVGEGRVICAISGGIDSSVTALLVGKAIGERLLAVFVDHGLLRQGEAEECIGRFKELGIEVIHVQAQERFLNRLKGVVDPEEKRRLIGEEFIRIFEEEAKRQGNFEFLAQGTLYPDLIESTTRETKAAARIKTHHNVGGLPKKMKFQLIEPLKYLFKDEVREVGLALGLPDRLVYRQPFPGPGLAVRIVGEVTEERLEILRTAQTIVEEEIEKAETNRQLWQYFAILTPVRTVGVMGDSRTYQHVVAIRAVRSEDGMTADWAHLPYEILERMASRMVNELRGINRVVYDITSKPPATIEWE